MEPKKREVFETVTSNAEYLSGSSNDLNVGKGNTNTQSTEQTNILTGGGVNAGGVGINFGGQFGTQSNNGTAQTETTTADASRQSRETVSHGSTMNQLYQIFNAYHLGTNRAVFMMSPRPHTLTPNAFNPQVSPNFQTDPGEFNLIDGIRQLEGIQDLFLVVYVPNVLNGICVKAQLDTGYSIPVNSGSDASTPSSLLAEANTAFSTILSLLTPAPAIAALVPATGTGITPLMSDVEASRTFESKRLGSSVPNKESAAYFNAANALIQQYAQLPLVVSSAQTAIQNAITSVQNNDPSASGEVATAVQQANSVATSVGKLQSLLTALDNATANWGHALGNLPNVATLQTLGNDVVAIRSGLSTLSSDTNVATGFADQAQGGVDYLLVTRRDIWACVGIDSGGKVTPTSPPYGAN